jgi:hypothetical protein
MIRPQVNLISVRIRDDMQQHGWSVEHEEQPVRKRGGDIVKSTLYVTEPTSGKRFAVTVERA